MNVVVVVVVTPGAATGHTRYPSVVFKWGHLFRDYVTLEPNCSQYKPPSLTAPLFDMNVDADRENDNNNVKQPEITLAFFAATARVELKSLK